MKFKLDENLDAKLGQLLVALGHEADSVRDEGLGGTRDEELFRVCVIERRVLVTLDLDFSDPLRFPPRGSAGIMVLRPQRNTLPLIRAALAAALPVLTTQALDGALWIVEPGRIRVNRPEAE